MSISGAGPGLGNFGAGMLKEAQDALSTFGQYRELMSQLADVMTQEEMRQSVEDGLRSMMYKSVQKTWDNFVNSMQMAFNMKTTVS